MQISPVRAGLDSLNSIEGVRNVYLAYYSLEGSDKDLEADGKDKVV